MNLRYEKMEYEDKHRLEKCNYGFSSNVGVIYKVLNEVNGVDKVVAHIQFDKGLIYMVEVYYEGKGICTEIIKHFFKKRKTFKGNAYPSALGFWKKIGAKFLDQDIDDINKYLNSSEKEKLKMEDNEFEGYYPPFTLNKDDFLNATCK